MKESQKSASGKKIETMRELEEVMAV